MRRLNSVVTDEVQLEIGECDCGYHFGVDATFLDQVVDSDFTFNCPSCGEEIDTGELFSDEPPGGAMAVLIEAIVKEKIEETESGDAIRKIAKKSAEIFLNNMEVECPVCRCRTVEFVDGEVRCRGECGTIWKKDRWDGEMAVRKSLASYEEAAEKGALIHDLDAGDGSDYTLKEGHNSCWITVGNLSVYVVRTDEGVSADIYPKSRETDGPLASTWALFIEGDPNNREQQHRDQRPDQTSISIEQMRDKFTEG